ncbi:MAG: hypothetical protein P8R42_14325 [Candidatus Binatia bacterium]|nr:hypothetical protein [Candidatus Binatia bacterium]
MGSPAGGRRWPSGWAFEHDLEPGLVALLIGTGIPLSMLIAPIWWNSIG